MLSKVINEAKDDHRRPTNKEHNGNAGQKGVSAATSSIDLLMLTWGPITNIFIINTDGTVR